MSKKYVFIIIVTFLITNRLVFADPVVIAGSSLESPPAFWDNSFYGITPSLDQAFPFTLAVEGQYRLESLEVAAYHYQNSGGSTATYSLALDNTGLPGEIIDTFHVSNISTTPQILIATANQQTIVNSGLTYWIIGETSQGQVNWNLSSEAFGPSAYRVSDGDWIYRSNGNVGAFVIQGTVIPEPCSLVLLSMGGLLFRSRKQ